MESVTRLMNLLGAEGIGGKISAGFGKFQLMERVTLDGSEPVCLQPLAKMLREESASHYILLTSSLPTDDELPAAMENAQYTLIRRAGFVQSDRIFNPRKKRTQYFFAAGSVFGRKFDGDLYDVGENMPHPVYTVCGNVLEAVACPDVHYAGFTQLLCQVVRYPDAGLAVIDPEFPGLLVGRSKGQGITFGM
jgi:CRISPR type III-A-associated RAMP protein Csm4